MCGIFGVIDNQESKKTIDNFIELGKKSEARGKEASGYFFGNNEAVHYFKSPSKFSDRKNVRDLRKNTKGQKLNFIIGHTRLKTDGDETYDENNQPCVYDNNYIVHNGIITNHKEIKEGTDFSNKELDTYAILYLMKIAQKNNKLLENFNLAIEKLKGEITTCLYNEVEKNIILFTNTGSLYYILNKYNKITQFASEKWILEKYLKKDDSLLQLGAFNGLQIEPNGLIISKFNVKPGAKEINYTSIKTISDQLFTKEIQIPDIKRCSKCILPETVPFINFDKNNICIFCRRYKKIPLKKIEQFEKKIKSEKVLIVGLSGGRDSSYGVSVLKEIYKGNIISASYDWGMITDLARRNQARVTGILGIEHVWASADIPQKRKNIRKNLYAWLEKPDLGMIPILMAGDKVWQDILHDIAEKNSANYILQFQSPYEVTQFKYGFANIPPIFDFQDKKFLNTNLKLKARLFLYYFFGILKNWRYWNSSLIDSFKGYISFNFKKNKLLYPFEYMEFNEDHINSELENKFQWEFDEHNPSSWRIGDGTAPFYNLIYWKFCGFTENDFFRSNQIRDKKIDREIALKKTLYENQIKDVRVKEYLECIDADYDYVMKKIDSAFIKNAKEIKWKRLNYKDFQIE